MKEIFPLEKPLVVESHMQLVKKVTLLNKIVLETTVRFDNSKDLAKYLLGSKWIERGFKDWSHVHSFMFESGRVLDLTLIRFPCGSRLVLVITGETDINKPLCTSLGFDGYEDVLTEFLIHNNLSVQTVMVPKRVIREI